MSEILHDGVPDQGLGIDVLYHALDVFSDAGLYGRIDLARPSRIIANGIQHFKQLCFHCLVHGLLYFFVGYELVYARYFSLIKKVGYGLFYEILDLGHAFQVRKFTSQAILAVHHQLSLDFFQPFWISQSGNDLLVHRLRDVLIDCTGYGFRINHVFSRCPA